LKILAIGDIIGKPGREATIKMLGELCPEYAIDMVIANGENLAGGIGLTPSTAQELLEAGVNVITSGNHIWAHKDILPYLDSDLPILRPLNYPPGVAGRGFVIHQKVAVVNIIGRTFMGNYDCPFRAMDKLLAELPSDVKTVIVDFHAEATSEKVGMGHYLDGRVSAVLGTHTHVPTADEQILPGGTAYITDIGMVGPKHSVIGVEIDQVLERMLTQIPRRLPVAGGRQVIFDAVVVEIDSLSGRATAIERLHHEVG